ncbi:alpha/beta hydrolase [Tychonema sp. LEGE 07203]|uniref:alpha/beta hydrolase n=1 Tax=Tychonema sp. LEGE 07203 TaxID=1828671 RepID=UPI001D135204|nr:alpha/beta hydrolase [Tychonema sp. LEGE 07203]
MDFVDRPTGRHLLDSIYEKFAKPQLHDTFKPTNPSIYIRHEEGQVVDGNYTVEKVFEDSGTGFYAESRLPVSGNNPPVLVIRGYGSWYPFDRVLEDSPDVFVAKLERQLKSAQTAGAVDWIKQQFHSGNPPDVVGESLGGKVAQQIAAKYPDYIRSTVIFNSVGVSEKLAQTSTAKNVFHYFTLGERYAFWANEGDYIPGKIFVISQKGENCCYKLEEAIVRRAHFERKFCKRRVLVAILAQLLLLNRHNAIVLNQKKPVVVEIDRAQLQIFRKNRFV